MRVAAMSDAVTISREELRQIVRDAVREAFDDVGLQVENKADIKEAREDFRFIRRLRRGVSGAANKVGMAVIMALVGGFISIFILGAEVLLRR